MLRIHFDDRDIARVQIAAEPDPLWETMLAMHQLAAAGRGVPVYAAWRARARVELAERGLHRHARLILALAPPGARYCPDFLTPDEARDGLTAGLAALCDTPAARLTAESSRAALSSRLPRWTAALAAGNRRPLDELATSIREVYGAVIAPDWTEVTAAVDVDRAARTRDLCRAGVDVLLNSLRPMARWEPPVLHVDYPADRDVWLRGRGLRLIPSHFCWRRPIALADPCLPPVLVYPVEHAPSWVPAASRTGRPQALSALLGRTRARVLAALDAPATTGELARRLSVSAPSASEHVSALREADLARSRRDGGCVVHALTPLGAALLHGDLAPVRVPR
ncbi:winged helix-turn-helix transcriptional regulator [Streptomyces piniterrae]|uniref:Winged helix-turn-helix transcriptional regulator n=1 Tax=Streptomyces piniterrae TaxID=2571125 RepID=A0A4U0MSY9_9ACTN|nr:helix-turn-helix domain-containing protein [Streptomyces piniterrae]TJZ44060.1 winged helix-turn-helix transcriptional regulator [Streptomyces piniterrae]